MTKYYKVYLNENLTSDADGLSTHSVICQYSPAINFFHKELVFKEIITGKIIYPSTFEFRKNITYSFFVLEEEIPHCFPLTQEDVKEWLKNMDEESLKKYIEDINRVEKIAKDAYEEEKELQKKLKIQEIIADKTIKRTLKKIKQR